MAKQGAPLPMRLKIQIKERTARGEKIKPLARELAVARNTVRKYMTTLTPKVFQVE